MTLLIESKKVHTFLDLLITLGQVLNQCVFLTLCECQSPNRLSTLNTRNMQSIPSTLQKHLCYLIDSMALPFFSFVHFDLYCLCAGAQNFWNFHSPCEFDVSRTSHSCALPIWKAFSKQLSSVKVKNGSCLCLLLFLILNCLLIAGLVLAKVMNVS